MGGPPRQGVARRPATGRASFGFCQSLRLRSPRGSSAPLFHRARHVRWWQEVWDGGDGLGPPSGAGCPGLCAPHSGPGSSGFADPPAPRTPGQLRAWWDEGVGAGPPRPGGCHRGPPATRGHGGASPPPGGRAAATGDPLPRWGMGGHASHRARSTIGPTKLGRTRSLVLCRFSRLAGATLPRSEPVRESQSGK